MSVAGMILGCRAGKEAQGSSPCAFLSEYRCWLVGFLAAFVVICVMFLVDGPIPTGAGLKKADWLAFLGSYLAFGGAVFVGLVAILQNTHYAEEESRRRALERVAH